VVLRNAHYLVTAGDGLACNIAAGESGDAVNNYLAQFGSYAFDVVLKFAVHGFKKLGFKKRCFKKRCFKKPDYAKA